MRIYLEVNVERTSGKMVTKDEAAEEIVGLVDGQTIQPGDSEYEVTEVNVIPEPKQPTKKKVADGQVDKV